MTHATVGTVLVNMGITRDEIFAAKPLFQSKPSTRDSLGKITVGIIIEFKHVPAKNIFGSLFKEIHSHAN